MYFSTGLILAALAAAVQAVQFDFPATGFAPVEGQPMTLAWSDAQGPVTITLKDGPSTDLESVQVITSDSTDTSFVWTPKDIPSGSYALAITDGVGTNYSPMFPYAGTAVVSTTVSSSSVTESVTTSVTTESASNVTMTTMTTMTSETSEESTATMTSATSSAEETEEPTTILNTNGSQRLGASMALGLGLTALFALLN